MPPPSPLHAPLPPSQSPLAQRGILDKYGVELIGAKLGSINKAEDRDLFAQVPPGGGLTEGCSWVCWVDAEGCPRWSQRRAPPAGGRA